MGKKLRAVREIVIVAAGLGAAALVWQGWQADAGRGPSIEAQASLARTACRTQIADQLRDPGNAEWNVNGWPTTSLGEGRFLVEPSLRAPNAFGAMMPSRWVCEVQVDGSTRRILRLEEA